MLTSCCMWTMSPQTHIPQGKSQLCIFDDKEPVIKIIIRGRSPTMRHVSRSNRGAIDLLFDRINVDSRNQMKYVDNKNQFADVFTKVSHVMSGIIFFVG